MKISVLMAVCNESESLVRESIESILNQTFRDFEFIIILDNENNQKLFDLISDYSRIDRRVKLFYNKNKFGIKGGGLASSMNFALLQSEGYYIARMDADDVAKPDRLEKQLAFAKKSKADLMFGWVNYIDRRGRQIGALAPKRNKVKQLKNYIFKDNLLVHPTLFAKREVMCSEMYDKEFLRSQDHELWLRMIIKGYSFDLLEDYVLDFRLPPEDDLVKRIDKVKNFNQYALKAVYKHYNHVKHFPGFKLWVSKLIKDWILFKIPTFLIVLMVRKRKYSKVLK